MIDSKAKNVLMAIAIATLAGLGACGGGGGGSDNDSAGGGGDDTGGGGGSDDDGGSGVTATITAISPTTAQQGEYVTYTVTGTGLTDSATFDFPGCIKMSMQANGTANQRQFRCLTVGAVGAATATAAADSGGKITKSVSIDITKQAGLAVTQIAQGIWHSHVITEDGSLWSAGGDSFGELALGMVTGQDLATFRKVGSDYKLVSAGEFFSIGIKTDGTLWGWGNNESGSLGQGAHSVAEPVPLQIGTDNDWVAIQAGQGHALAQRTDGSVWGWGSNSSKQLGEGDYDIYTPFKFADNAKSFCASPYATMIVSPEGVLTGYGSNDGSRMAGATTEFFVPDGVVIMDHVKQVACAGQSWATFVVKDDGSAWAWGNKSPVLGDGTTTGSSVPVKIIDSGVAAVFDGGTGDAYALLEDGTLLAWGINNRNSAGFASGQAVLVPTKLMEGAFSAVSSGSNSMALMHGLVWAWGQNVFGELGLGHFQNTDEPVLVKFPAD